MVTKLPKRSVAPSCAFCPVSAKNVQQTVNASDGSCAHAINGTLNFAVPTKIINYYSNNDNLPKFFTASITSSTNMIALLNCYNVKTNDNLSSTQQNFS